MKIKFTLITFVILLASGCATTPTNKITYTADVRKMSYTDNTLFKDSLRGLTIFEGGHLKENQKIQVVKIEVIVPYDNRRVGIERWILTRDDSDAVAYVIKMIPDGNGGTNFNIGKDNGKANRDVPLLPPPPKH